MNVRPPFGSRLRARIRSLVRGLLHRTAVEEEMREEFRAHVELRTDDLVAQGMERGDASRQAHREFGHVETHRAAARKSRGLGWVDQLRFSWIDLRLGLRMMSKYPGLTLVAVVALAVGIPTGLAPTHLARALDRPLPEDRENRIRTIRFWNPVDGTMRLPTFGDLTLLSGELTSFERLGAYRSGGYNIGSDEGRAAPVTGAELTASMMSMLQVAPLLGRLLDQADETPGSADVAVIGYRLWQGRFGGDADIVGRTVRVGGTPVTVVGVMPEGFRFPVSDQVWLPLRRDGSVGPGEGGPVRIVGRLADGVSEDEAQSELATVAFPPSHPAFGGPTAHRLEVVPFAYTYVGLPRGGLASLPEYHALRLLGAILLLVACANVAMLIFARTATRFRELAVRTALGAGRWRIVSQVFAETLVLAVVAGATGLVAVDRVIAWIPWQRLAGETSMPYWLDLGVPAGVLPLAAFFTVVSATVAGVLPALRVTGGDIHRTIRAAESGRSGIRFGRGTSALIVADVAVAVAVIGFAFGISRYMTSLSASSDLVGIPAEEYLAVEVRLSANELPGPGDPGAPVPRLARLQQTLAERLGTEREVRGVVFADALPRMNHRSRPVEVDGPEGGREGARRWVRVARVEVDFFRALEQPILAGRDFDRADTEADVRPVVVNTLFVDRMLGGGDAIGRRLRFPSGLDAAAPWHEIVGVVGHLGMNTVSRTGDEGVYLVEPPGAIHPVQLGIRLGADPLEYVPRLRELVSEADPAAILGRPVVLGEVQQGDWYVAIGITAGFGLLVSILVALAASGIYAIMSFSVSERTREIGIRTALGAGRASLVVAILRRALAQLGVGALLGIPVAAWLQLQISDPESPGTVVWTSAGTAILLGLATVSLVGLLSCVAPARRALRIEANEALRAEG